MPFFEDLFYELRDKIAILAKSEVKEYADEAVEDAKELLLQSKLKLKEWTLALTDGMIDKELFAWLIDSQFKLIEMKVLTQAGITQIKIEKLKDAIRHLVVDTILSKVLKV